MKTIRRFLIGGGIFNSMMGVIFFCLPLLRMFFSLMVWAEDTVFRHSGILPFPQNPVHLLLIQGFGAGVLILGAMLIYSARDPIRYLPFIFFDGLGRLLYGSLMIFSVFRYSLLWMILVFGIIELSFALSYIAISWKLSEP
jgi:hypothetical protein